MTRIVLLGPTGAGKTTLGQRLAEVTGAPLICLDELASTGGVTPEQVPGFRALMTELHAGEAWISDGNYAAVTFDIRLSRADRIVWLEPAKAVSVWRALTRPFKPGEPHKLSGLPAVLRFIWRFDRVNRPRIEALREQHGPDVPVVRLSGRREVEAFVDGLAR